MNTQYRCLNCYAKLTKEEYFSHRRSGHVTVEYIVCEDPKPKWSWPFLRYSGSHKEYMCEHGVGHSRRGIHGCDGCCSKEGFPKEDK